MKLGVKYYWLSQESWDWFLAHGRSKAEVLERGGGLGARAYIDYWAAEWSGCKLEILDSELRELYERRVGEGLGGVNDTVLYRALFDGWNRAPRGMNLQAETVEALGLWAVKWKLPVKQRPIGAVAMAGVALELIGRRWIDW